MEGQYLRSRQPGLKKVLIVLPIWGSSASAPDPPDVTGRCKGDPATPNANSSILGPRGSGQGLPTFRAGDGRERPEGTGEGAQPENRVSESEWPAGRRRRRRRRNVYTKVLEDDDAEENDNFRLSVLVHFQMDGGTLPWHPP